MMQYEPHAYALVFPEMPADQFRRLLEDIRANGLNHAITLYEGKILDGRHRYRACNEAGVVPRFKEYSGPDAGAYVTSENASRRHLSPSQLGMVGARLAGVESERARQRQVANLNVQSAPRGADSDAGRTAEVIAKRLGIGENTVGRAIKVLKNAEPEVVKAVEQGVMTVNEASKVVELNPPSQKRIAAIENPQRRAKELGTALQQSRSKRALHNRIEPPAQPGTAFVREFLGALERTTIRLSSEYKLKDPGDISKKFLAEFDWSQSQLRAQLDLVMPLCIAMSLITSEVEAKSAA